MVSGLINANPVVYEKKERRARNTPDYVDENAIEKIDQLEIFDILFICVRHRSYGLSSFIFYYNAINM